MKRDELLAKGYTEEQVTDLLNMYHTQNTEISNLNKKLESKTELEKQNADLQKQLDDINKAKLTEQEKLELAKQETEKNLKESRKIYNKAKVKEILAGYDIEDDIINSFVTEDENTSINGANLFKTRLDTIIADTTKKVQDSIASIDVRPNASNNPNQDATMTFDKFAQMSAIEQEKFINEHPQEFQNLK